MSSAADRNPDCVRFDCDTGHKAPYAWCQPSPSRRICAMRAAFGKILVPHRLVDNIAQWFACNRRGHVVNDYLEVSLHCLRGIPLNRNMWCHQKVRCVPPECKQLFLMSDNRASNPSTTHTQASRGNTFASIKRQQQHNCMIGSKRLIKRRRTVGVLAAEAPGRACLPHLVQTRLALRHRSHHRVTQQLDHPG